MLRIAQKEQVAILAPRPPHGTLQRYIARLPAAPDAYAAALSFPATIFIAWVDFNENMEYTATKGERILRVSRFLLGVQSLTAPGCSKRPSAV